jgi:hypothetical protein
MDFSLPKSPLQRRREFPIETIAALHHASFSNPAVVVHKLKLE